MGLDYMQRAMLKEACLLPRPEFGQWIRALKERGSDIAELLGTPFYLDEDKKTHAVWFDALEIADFIPER